MIKIVSEIKNKNKHWQKICSCVVESLKAYFKFIPFISQLKKAQMLLHCFSVTSLQTVSSHWVVSRDPVLYFFFFFSIALQKIKCIYFQFLKFKSHSKSFTYFNLHFLCKRKLTIHACFFTLFPNIFLSLVTAMTLTVFVFLFLLSFIFLLLLSYLLCFVLLCFTFCSFAFPLTLSLPPAFPSCFYLSFIKFFFLPPHIFIFKSS